MICRFGPPLQVSWGLPWKRGSGGPAVVAAPSLVRHASEGEGERGPAYPGIGAYVRVVRVVVLC